MTIKLDETTVMDYIRYDVRYFITTILQIEETRLAGTVFRKKKSVQNLIGIMAFTENGLTTSKEEHLF